MKELEQIARRLTSSPLPRGALATLVSVEGSSYRRAGARLLWLSDGTRIGSISGGCLEEDLLARLRQVTATGQPAIATYDTTAENDLVWGVGLGCHGIVRILIEPVTAPSSWAATVCECIARRQPCQLEVNHRAGEEKYWGTVAAGKSAQDLASATDAPAPRKERGQYIETIPAPLALIVFGAGDDALPLVRLASDLGWHVTVADPRPAFATAERFPAARAVLTGPIETLIQQTRYDDQTVAVIMTHHYVHDRPLLRALLPKRLRYLGLLGPRKRADRILLDVQADGLGLTAEMRETLHAPVGLDLGADGAAEVALSIVAEIQAVLAGRNAQSLRDRTRPIHS